MIFFVWLLLLMAQVFFFCFLLNEIKTNKQTERKKTCEYNEGLKGKKSMMMMSQTGAIYDARPMFFFHWLADLPD